MSVPSPMSDQSTPSTTPFLGAPSQTPFDIKRGGLSSWWHEMGPREKWAVGSGGALLGLFVIAVGGATGAYVSWRNQGKIAPGVFVQGVAVGDMTPAQAKAALGKKFSTLKVRFETPEKTYVLGLRQFGGGVQIDRAVQDAFWFGRSGSLLSNARDVWKSRSEPRILGLPIKWDKKGLRTQMALIAGQYRREAQDARLVFSGGDLVTVPETPGRAINAGATLADLQKKYRIGSDRIAVTVRELPARIAASDLEGRNVQLGSYTTSFNSGLWGRTRNIRLAAAAIDGRVLMPGDKFSFNQCTGERTWDKGYRIAHIFEDRGNGAEVVDGLAGGVCQVSTTLYNAVRRANQKLPAKVFMRINERNYHSLPVTYVSAGMDATVAWPHKDFRFTNTLSHPVYLRAHVQGSRLTTMVWGRIPSSMGSPFSPRPSVQLASNPRSTS